MRSKRAFNDILSVLPPGRRGQGDLPVLAISIASLRALDKNTEDLKREIAKTLADLQLGPESYEKLLGYAYSKPWPEI